MSNQKGGGMRDGMEWRHLCCKYISASTASKNYSMHSPLDMGRMRALISKVVEYMHATWQITLSVHTSVRDGIKLMLSTCLYTHYHCLRFSIADKKWLPCMLFRKVYIEATRQCSLFALMLKLCENAYMYIVHRYKSRGLYLKFLEGLECLPPDKLNC